MSTKFIPLKVRRNDQMDSESYWEECFVPYRKNMNVISALMEVQKNPVNSDGEKVRTVDQFSSSLSVNSGL